MTHENTSLPKTFVVSRNIKTGQFVPVSKVGSSKTQAKGASKATHNKLGRNSKSGQFVEEKYRVSGKSVETISKASQKRSSTLKNLAKR